MIAALVLAAGASERMGEPKALLTIHGKTFLNHIITTLHSARILHQYIVLGANAERILPTLDRNSGTVVVNKHWEEGQLSSIVTGITALDRELYHGVMICPVDHPLISQSLLVDVLHGFWKSGKNIILPTYHGKRGHPVLFGKAMLDELCSAPNTEGAKAVIRKYPDEIFEVPVTDEGILLNIDTPSDYQTLKTKLSL